MRRTHQETPQAHRIRQESTLVRRSRQPSPAPRLARRSHNLQPRALALTPLVRRIFRSRALRACQSLRQQVPQAYRILRQQAQLVRRIQSLRPWLAPQASRRTSHPRGALEPLRRKVTVKGSEREGRVSFAFVEMYSSSSSIEIESRHVPMRQGLARRRTKVWPRVLRTAGFDSLCVR